MKNRFFALPDISDFEPACIAHVAKHGLLRRRFAGSNSERRLCQIADSSSYLCIEGMVFLTLFLAFSVSLFSNEIKLGILEKEKALEVAVHSAEKSAYYFDIALNYLKDQDQEKAFKHFLLALKHHEGVKKSDPCPEENELYQEALDFYIKEGAIDPLNTASKIISKYGKKAEAHPDYYHLNMLIASSYANLGEFEKFFTFFYENYSHLKDSFLAYKASAMLNLRLYSIATKEDEKKYFEKEGFYFLKLALSKNAKDASLYKFLMLSSKNNEEKILYLRKLCENKVKLPRNEILFYINEAKECCEKELGFKIIEMQSEFYEYSRAIDEAKKHLDKG